MSYSKSTALAAAIIAFASTARAESFFQFEAGAGAAHYSDAGDGIWFQQGMSHNLHLSAPAFRLAWLCLAGLARAGMGMLPACVVTMLVVIVCAWLVHVAVENNVNMRPVAISEAARR